MGVCLNKAELLKELSVIQDRPVSTAIKIIKELPTIDLVRCGECKYYDKFPTWSACTYWSGDPYEQASVNDDDYCSYGERRADEHTD